VKELTTKKHLYDVHKQAKLAYDGRVQLEEYVCKFIKLYAEDWSTLFKLHFKMKYRVGVSVR
jgi:hypothetical protein